MRDDRLHQLEEILEHLAEGYYPEHEYGEMWRKRNAESRAEALQSILFLVQQEVNDAK